MKTVVALYDIHGNLPALEAVLADVEALDVDEIVVGGDVVPGPMPAGCMAALAGLDVPVRYIHGNGERDVLALHMGARVTRVPEAFHGAMRWSADQLSEAQRSDVGRWPATTRIEVDGVGDVLFCHATPRDENELFTADTPEDRLRAVMEAPGADLVVCGHTHMQFDRDLGSVRVINAGSVGMPFGETGAFWALLGPGVELRRTEYDLEAAAARIDETEYASLAGFDLRKPPPAEQMREMFEAQALLLG